MTAEQTPSRQAQCRDGRTSTSPFVRLAGRIRDVGPAGAAPLALVGGAAVATYSVPRYHVLIVTTYLVLLGVLAVTTVRARPTRAAGDSADDSTDATAQTAGRGGDRIGGAVALVAAGLAIWLVPAFSYVPAPRETVLRFVTGICAVLAAAALASSWRRGPHAAVALAAITYTATAAAVVRLDPAPRIDVWYTLQGAADGLARFENLYEQVLVGPPGRMAAFTYLPWTAVALAPGRWLGGDVRWALVAVTLATAAVMLVLGGRRAPLAATLLLLLPGTLTQVEQAWTEPLLLGCLAAAVLAVRRGVAWWAVLPLAVALASKQHVVLVLPVLAAWPRFGVRRTVATALAAGGLVLPWFVADPAAMWHDTVELLVGFHPIRFADTAYIALMNETGVEPPFWLTGAVVLGVLTTASVMVRRRDPGTEVVLRWCALVLFVASFVNKQAFYNQYWLVAGLVLLSWAAGRPLRSPAGARTAPLTSSPA